MSNPHDDIPTLYFQQFTEGLSENNVRCIVEDHRGYIWMGTGGGLNRFDGTQIKIFEMDEADSTSIPDNRINDLLIDSQQQLWIATYHSLARYVEDQDNFVVLNKDPSIGREPYLDALSLHEDKKGKLWVGTQHGLFVLNAAKNSLVRPEQVELQELEKMEINSMEEVGNNLWFGSSHGLYIWERKNNSLHEVISNEGDNAVGEVRELLADSKGNVWVASFEKGLFKISQNQFGRWVFKSFYDKRNPILNDHSIFSVYEDSEQKIWIGTESQGINLYLPEQESFHSYTKDIPDKLGLKSNSIQEIFEDKTGRFFFGSNNQGFFLYDPYAINFNHKDQLFGFRLKFSTVTSFLEDGDNIWIGTDGGGISVWDRKNKHYSFLNHDPQNPNTLGSNEVLCILKDSRGIIWTGNWNGGLNRYDPKTQTFKTYKNNAFPNSIGSNSVFNIKEDKNGDLWLSTWGYGISRFNRSTGDFFNIGYQKYNDALMSHYMTYDLEIDDLSGDIWVATVLGLDRISMIDHNNYTIKHFSYSQEKKSSISAPNVHSIFEDSQHRLWVGTVNGLNLYDREKENFTHFHTGDGLPSNFIKDIIQYEEGEFWISTAKGLAKMTEDEQGFHFEIFTKSDGLQADEFFFNSFYLSSKKELFVGGVNGFNHFDPRNLKRSPYAPQMQLTSFKLFNKEVEIGEKDSPLHSHINSQSQIILEKNQSAFSLEFQGVNMTSPDKNEYEYMLQGFDEDWNKVGNRTIATYTNLDAGEYVFMLKGANRDGIWSPIRKIHFEILPYWYQSWWARLLFWLGPLALISSLVLIRISFIKAQKKKLSKLVAIQTTELLEQKNEIENQAEQLQQLNHQKNKIFSIISHDLRSPITTLQGITNMLDPEILAARDLNLIKEKISQKIENIGNAMVNLLDWSKSQMEGEVSLKEEFSISSLAAVICNMYQMTASQKKIHLINNISGTDKIYADPNQIRIVLRNLIGNALKFTHADDQVCLSSEVLSNEEILIKVSDTGIGMDEDQLEKLFQLEYNKSTSGTSGEKGVGLGLLLVKEYIEKNGGKIFVESEKGVGTSFYFSLLRCKQASYSLTP
ncbi:MAG: two-component regulator propeller domain-containing protein [Bacteroidia bacterium]|nr:two-component regulator propeller domain-containing protein [Bacteroidia bacterium]